MHFQNNSKLRVASSDSLVGEIVDTLRALGGAAHVAEIQKYIIQQRRRNGEHPVKTIHDDIAACIRAHGNIEDAPEAKHGALFYRPFGDGSRRWAICSPTRTPTTRRSRAARLVAVSG